MIKWFTCFKGHYIDNDATGPFDFWESTQNKFPPNIVFQWLKRFKDYTGCINIECIRDKMIECHLRMGDIDNFANKNLLKSIIDVYSGKDWNFKDTLKPIYLFPVWGKEKHIKLFEKHPKKVEKLCKDLLCFQIDNPNMSNPPKYLRIMNLTSNDYDIGIDTRNKIYKWLEKSLI